jgi:hypothetical protein
MERPDSNPYASPLASMMGRRVDLLAGFGIVLFCCGLICYAVALLNMRTLTGAIVVEAGHGSILVGLFCLAVSIYFHLPQRFEEP